MPRNDPKMMWSARLPSALVGQIADAAEEEEVSQADLAEQIFGEWLDARSSQDHPLAAPSHHHDGRGPGVSRLEDAARAALTTVVDELPGELEQAILCVRRNEDEGVVVGLVADPLQLLTELVEFATIAAGAAGRQLRVVVDE